MKRQSLYPFPWLASAASSLKKDSEKSTLKINLSKSQLIFLFYCKKSAKALLGTTLSHKDVSFLLIAALTRRNKQ